RGGPDLEQDCDHDHRQGDEPEQAAHAVHRGARRDVARLVPRMAGDGHEAVARRTGSRCRATSIKATRPTTASTSQASSSTLPSITTRESAISESRPVRIGGKNRRNSGPSAEIVNTYSRT